MKKFALSVIAAMSLSSMAYAATSSTGYFSTQSPKLGMTAAVARMFPPTDITIVNASNNVIYVSVANAIYDRLYPENTDHIRHPTEYGNTYISLNNPNHVQFWQGSVCRLAVITVFGHPGYYTTKVDSELCN